MSLVDLYNKSQALRPTQAREIPNQAVDFVDREKRFQVGFTTGQVKGTPSTFTPLALNYYDELLRQLTPPQSYNPQIPLNQWNPTNKYAPDGAPAE